MPRVIVCEKGGGVSILRGCSLVAPFCELCLRTGDGQEADWRIIEVDGEPHAFCPRHFPAIGSSTAKWQAAFRRCVLEIQRRRKLRRELTCIRAIFELNQHLAPELRVDAAAVLTDKFGDWQRTLDACARKRIVAQELEVAGLVTEMRLRASQLPDEARKHAGA